MIASELYSDYLNRLLSGDRPGYLKIVKILLGKSILIRKLEDKIIDTDKSRAELVKYANELKKEIEEKEEAEKFLSQREEQYRTLVECMSEGLMMVDNEDTILFVNKQFCEMSGYSGDELYGMTGYAILFNKADQKVIWTKNKLRVQGIRDTYEIQLLRKDGSEVWVKISGSPVYNLSGKITGSMGVIENIHEKKLIAKQLIQEQELFQTLAQVSPVGIFRTRPDGYTTYVNPKWTELSGLSYEAALGDGWLDAVHPEDKDKLQRHWGSDTHHRTSSAAEYRFLRSDGSIVWVLGYAVPELHQETIAGYVGTITDVTERKKFEAEILDAKEKAEASDRLKTAFMNNISHEVRTPLNGILGFGEMIVQDDLTPEEKTRYLKILTSSSDRLLKTITDYMDISLIASGNLEVRPGLFNLNEFLDQLYLEQVVKASSKSLKVILQKSETGLNYLMNTDAALLKKVFNNLFDNALKFSTSGTIQIGYSVLCEQVRFFIKDNGIGIATDKLTQIFEHFRQEDQLITRKFEGSGLGLSIAKGIVELLNGKIWVESVKGEGSVFYFEVPCDMSVHPKSR